MRNFSLFKTQLSMFRVAAAVLLSLCVSMIAEAYRVSGSVAERSSKEPLPYTSYQVFAAADSVPLVSDVTDEEGRFALELASGDYRIGLEYIGSLPAEKHFKIEDADVDLGMLLLDTSEEEEQLEAVTVVARKDLISSDGAKLTYDAERDPSASTSTILEILRKVPMVTVDGEDNIKVKGNSNFKIYINGKPDPLLSGDPSTVLRSMPASSIKKIEVITDPGAKYDAEGVAGILNIVMDKKQSIEGYNVSGNVSLSSNGGFSSLYGRTKVRNVTASMQVYYNDGTFFRPHQYSDSERIDYANDRDYRNLVDSRQQSKFRSGGGNLSLSWEPDTLNLFSFSLRYYNGVNPSEVTQQNLMEDVGGNRVWSYDRFFTTRNTSEVLTPYFSYQHTFPNNQQHSLTLSYQLSHWGNTYDADQTSYNFFGIEGSLFPLMRTENSWDGDEHTFQADYALPLGEHHTFEAGAKALLRKPKGNTVYLSGAEEAALFPTSLFHLGQINDLFALYAAYSGSFGLFSARAGLRYELSRMGLRYREQLNTDYPDFTTNLNDVVPNASLTFKFDNASNLRASYSMRIQRPSLNQLSPAVNDLTYGSLFYGNPNLKTAHANKFELKYSNYGGKFSGEAEVNYSLTNDDVGRLMFMQDGIEHTTFENIGRSQLLTLGGYLTYQITNEMEIGLNGLCLYNDYKSDKGLVALHSHGWDWSLFCDYSYTTPFKMRIDAWGGYSSGSIYMQTKSSEWYNYGVNLSRSFLKNDMLTINLSANNVLPSHRRVSSVTTTATTRTRASANYRCWNVGVSISIRFGNLRQDVKQTRARISNNDTISSDNDSTRK